MTDEQLLQHAADVRKNAYAPFSEFYVGAALLTADGKLYTGCNVENSSYGLSICAERNAIAAMVAAQGHTGIQRVAVVANRLASPCGACRQVIVEFGDEIEVISASADDRGNISRWRITELLPAHFKL